MIVEFTILPIGAGDRLTRPIAEVVELIRHSGLEHQVTAMGTLVEGDGDALWALLRKCHEVAVARNGRVFTEIRIDQDPRRAPHMQASAEAVDAVLRARRELSVGK